MEILKAVISISPGVLIVFLILARRPGEKLPVRLVSRAFLLGILSFILALGLEYLLFTYSLLEEQNMIHQFIRAFVFVALVEEGSKFMLIRGFLFNSSHFSRPFDGILFAVLVGIGFATVENFIYMFREGSSLLGRMFFSVPAHAIFSLIMGFFIGEARIFPSSRGMYLMLSLLFATLAHGYYDYFLFLENIEGIWIQAIVSMLIFVFLLQGAYYLRKDEIIGDDLF